MAILRRSISTTQCTFSVQFAIYIRRRQFSETPANAQVQGVPNFYDTTVSQDILHPRKSGTPTQFFLGHSLGKFGTTSLERNGTMVERSVPFRLYTQIKTET